MGEQGPERCMVYCSGLPPLSSPFPPLHSTSPWSLPTDLTTAVLRETQLGRSISTTGLGTFLSGLLVLSSVTGT